MALNKTSNITLGFLLEGMVDDYALNSYKDVGVKRLVQDNRKAQAGDLFIAYQGFNTHGLLYAEDAVAKGVDVVVWDGECENCDEILNAISNKVVCIHCDDLKFKVGEIASRFYSNPSLSLNVIGVTGTNGKTSVSHFLAQSLDTNDVHCGILGTLGNGFINDLHPTGLTTVDSLHVQKTLDEIKQAGARHVVMEVSSHGMDQGRVDGVYFNTAVYTNISREHLDYHKTMDNYAAAKRKLFFMPGLHSAVVNLDDEFGRQLAKDCNNHLDVWGYSSKNDVTELKGLVDSVIYVVKVAATKTGLVIDVDTPLGCASFETGLLGQFNVSNILAVMCTMMVCGVSLEDTVNRVKIVKPVDGRMELISAKGKPTVVVDYAHTPDGLKAACQAVKEHFSGNLWCVFGCGGDRDKGKRPQMANIAESYADHVIVTTDNPRHENPKKIIEDIVKGFSNPEKIKVVDDRRLAIEEVIKRAGKEDVVLLAGKGHESSQLVGNIHIAFDDVRIAKEYLGVPI